MEDEDQMPKLRATMPAGCPSANHGGDRHMSCCVCGKEARVSIGGAGYCADCYNRMTEDLMGLEHVDHPRLTVSFDVDGRARAFDVERLIFGDVVSWTAREQGAESGFEFNVTGPVDEDPADALSRLYEKVDRCLSVRSAELGEVPEDLKNAVWPHAVWRGDRHLGLSEGSFGRLTVDGAGDLALVIDGELVTGREFLDMLHSYEGFTLRWQIVDPSDDPTAAMPPLAGE